MMRCPATPQRTAVRRSGRAYAEDAGRHRVRRARSRAPEERRAGDDQRGRRFAGEAVNGFQFEDLMPHGFDDFPAAHGSTERHKGGAEALDPERTAIVSISLKMKRAMGDRPHRFLGIVHCRGWSP